MATMSKQKSSHHRECKKHHRGQKDDADSYLYSEGVVHWVSSTRPDSQ